MPDMKQPGPVKRSPVITEETLSLPNGETKHVLVLASAISDACEEYMRERAQARKTSSPKRES